MMKILYIIASLIISVSVAYSLERECLEWADEEQTECLQYAPPTVQNMFFLLNKSEIQSEDGTYYLAYAIYDKQFRRLPVPCRYDGKDIVHLSSKDLELTNDPSYIGKAYSEMPEAIREACMVITYETEEVDPETKELKKVRNRVNERIYKTDGKPPKEISKTIPHVIWGAPDPS